MASHSFPVRTQSMHEVLTRRAGADRRFLEPEQCQAWGGSGLSTATVSRLRCGQTRLDPASKSFEAGQFLLRLFRSLDALMGSDDQASRRWLEARNLDLDARPLDLIDSFKGLITLCDYVDAHRARV